MDANLYNIQLADLWRKRLRIFFTAGRWWRVSYGRERGLCTVLKNYNYTSIQKMLMFLGNFRARIAGL